MRSKTRAIRAAVAAGVAMAGVIGLATPALAAPPANDDRADFIPLSLGVGAAGTTVEATLQPGEIPSSCPTGLGGDGGNTVWYSYTADVAQTVTFTLSSATDQGLALWDVSGTTEFDCDDSDLGGIDEQVSHAFVPNQAVLVSVFRFAPGDEGIFTLTASETAPPPPTERPFVAGVITSDPSVVNFGPVPVGTESPSQLVTYANTSSQSADVPYTYGGDLVQLNLGPGTTCVFSIDVPVVTIPSGECVVEYIFLPQNAGPQQSVLTLQYQNDSGPQDTTTTFQGEGVDDQPPPEVPEAPLALLLPGSTLLLGAGVYAIRRRNRLAAVIAE